LPHPWNAIDGQDGENDYYRGKCLYVKELFKHEMPEGEKYFIEFEGANSSAEVYVNGSFITSHQGGYSTFRAEITPVLKDRNIIAVAVDNSNDPCVYPQNADFTFYGGLYRNVNLIATAESHFDLEYHGGPGIAVTPAINGKDAEITVHTYISRHEKNDELHYVIKDAKAHTVAELQSSADEATAVLTIKDVHLWHGKKDPYLYTCEVFLCRNGKILDKVSTRFGCRSFTIDPEKGFFLNGEKYPLRGVSRHQDRWEWGNALLPEHHREDIELIKEVGANTVRLAHYQHSQCFYDLCDEYGMIVWAEIPYISTHAEQGFENTVSQMKELITQNYNHPSIVVWGLSNEITMGSSGKSDENIIKNHRYLNDLCHETDKTRLTTLAAVSMNDINDEYLKIPDVVAYNHYFGWYGGDVFMNGPWFDDFHRQNPDIPIGVSEYGCEALNWHTSAPAQGDYTEEYQAYYHEEMIKQLFTRDYLWATYVWNMFDFGADSRNEGGENGQNHKGLVTFDRKYKKDSFYAYKAWLSDEPFVHICSKRYIDRVEDITEVKVYSNQPEVELFANGKSLGKKKNDGHFFTFEVENKETTTLTAKAGDCEDHSFIRKVQTFNNNYRLKEKGAVLNWFDITEPEGFFSLNSRLDDIMKTEKGKELFSSILESAGEKSPFKSENIEPMMKMMGSFTLLRLISLVGAAGINITKEQMLSINEELNKIKKP
ncbi:MAG: glycoside hydrolase family 2 TIM barrel-domain containing protein, partial [Acutalibacteraceae bacterium]|nr:glycoside hydrolase family 2 TIM barrel-domain containing protein [Acutalibacteraceae bacterium]